MNSPITKSKNVTLLNQFNVELIINRWSNEFHIDIRDEFTKDLETIELYKCNDSELMFFEPKIAGSPSLYKKLHDTFYWYYLEEKWEYKVALKELDNSKNIIEIGCGKGTFIAEYLKKKNNSKIIGLDTNSNAVAQANDNKLPVFDLYLSDFLIQNPDFHSDAILAFQVLEHISDPIPFLDNLIKSLSIGGKLILCVPNQDCFYKYSDELLDMPPHHITKWSINTFKFLENLFPIKLKTIKTEPLFEMHINGWFHNTSKFYRTNKWYGKLIFNRITNPIIISALSRKNIRKLIKGHTLYVSFEKTS